MTGTSCRYVEYYLHLIEIPTHFHLEPSYHGCSHNTSAINAKDYSRMFVYLNGS